MRAVAAVVDGSLVVRVVVYRPGAHPFPSTSRFAGSVLLGPSCGGAFWRLLRPDPVWTRRYVAVSPDLLPGEAFQRAAESLDRKLAVPLSSVPPRDPLSPGELALVASLPAALKGQVPALLVMLG